MSTEFEHLGTSVELPVLIPEPPEANTKDPNSAAPIVAHRLDFVQLGLPEYRHKYVVTCIA